MSIAPPFSRPLPDADEVLVSLRLCEIDALVIVIDFELTDVPDDFWEDGIRHDLAMALEKFKRVQR